ncbi:MAG: hypothetical protein FJ317_09390, partial [SAR202 cluster bacterium]|nr:hypothetical protein [SAR202 cluster bacterium]
TGNPVKRTGNRVWGNPSMIYPCAPGGPDDYVTITITGDAWESIMAVIGRADLIGDERYTTPDSRNKRVEEIEAMISSWTSTRTKREVMETMAGLGIPCGMVQNTVEMLSDPHLRAREMVVDVDDPLRGRYQAFGCPVKVSENPIKMTPAPTLGQHTGEVLASLLDMPEREVARLRKAGVI